MSRKLSALIVGAVASLALLAGTMQGCGSSSSSGGNNYTALCEQSCDKLVMCVPDSGITAAQCKQGCTSAQTGTTTCSNASAIATAYQRCLSMDCAGFQSCIENDIPDCQTTSGTGGSGGGGGTTGSGGSSGAGCSNCTKFEACCVAEGGTTTQCNALSTTCAAAATAQQATYDSECASALSQLVAATSNVPAACR